MGRIQDWLDRKATSGGSMSYGRGKLGSQTRREVVYLWIGLVIFVALMIWLAISAYETHYAV